MSKWTDNYDMSPFRNNWASLRISLEKLTNVQFNDVNEIMEASRIQKAFHYMDNILAASDAELISNTLLEDLNMNTVSVLNNVDAYLNNGGDIGNLHLANQHIDSLLIVSQRLPVILPLGNKRKLPDVTSMYQRTIKKYLEKLRTDIDDLMAEIRERAVAVDISVSDQNDRIKQIDTSLANVKQSIDQQVAVFNTEFQNSQREQREKFDGLIDKLNDKMDDEFKGLTIKSGTILKAMAIQEAQAEQVLGVVVNTAQAGAYLQYANDERRIANKFRVAAILFILLAVAIIGVPLIEQIISAYPQAPNIDWKAVLWRLPISFVLFFPAVYMSREADKHRKNEFRNRQRQLILSSIDPYLALLDPKLRDDLKVAIAKSIFTETSYEEGKGLGGDVSDLMAQLSNLVKQIKS